MLGAASSLQFLKTAVDDPAIVIVTLTCYTHLQPYIWSVGSREHCRCLSHTPKATRYSLSSCRLPVQLGSQDRHVTTPAFALCNLSDTCHISNICNVSKNANLRAFVGSTATGIVARAH